MCKRLKLYVSFAENTSRVAVCSGPLGTHPGWVPHGIYTISVADEGRGIHSTVLTVV